MSTCFWRNESFSGYGVEEVLSSSFAMYHRVECKIAAARAASALYELYASSHPLTRSYRNEVRRGSWFCFKR